MPAPTPLQQIVNYTGGTATTSLTKAFTLNVQTGSRIFVVAGSQNNGSGTKDHTVDHTGTATVDSWTSVCGPQATTDSSPVTGRIWTARVTAGGTMTVRVTRNVSGTAFMGLAAAEYPNLSAAAGAAAIDVTHTGAGTSTSPSSGATGATGAANELAVGGYADQGNGKVLSAGSGWGHFQTQAADNDVNASYEDKDSGASGSAITATFSLNTSGTWLALVLVAKLASSGLSGTVAQVAETDTSQTLVRLKARTAAQIAETDVAQTVRPVKFRILGQATETDSVTGIARIKARVAAQSTETAVASLVSRAKTRTLGEPSESDSATVLTRRKVRPLGQPAQNEAAQAVTRPGGNILAQVLQTEAAQPLRGLKSAALGQAVQFGTGQVVQRLKSRVLGQPGESDLAETVRHWKGYILDQAGETDVALPLGATGVGTSLRERHGSRRPATTDAAARPPAAGRGLRPVNAGSGRLRGS